MQTIPDAVLDAIVEHRPNLAQMVENIRAYPDQAQQIERALATAYLAGKTLLTAQQTLWLAQVSYGGPWGEDWEGTTMAAARLGLTEGRIRQKIAAGELKAIKRGKTWYVWRK